MQRLLDQRKEWQVAADGRQVQAFKVLREDGERSMELQERAWKATAIQAELLRKQADDEQGLQDAINIATDQAQEAANTRRALPRLPGCTGGTGAEWEGKARGYSARGDSGTRPRRMCYMYRLIFHDAAVVSWRGDAMYGMLHQ